MRADGDALVRAPAQPGADAVVDAVAAATGALLCTVLRWDATTERLVRVASSRPVEYPVGGSKHFDRPWPAWLETCVVQRTGYAANGAAAVRAAFFDHELIASLGCAGYCTVPLLVGGAVHGMLNALGPLGWATQERLRSLVLEERQHPELGSLSRTEDA